MDFGHKLLGRRERNQDWRSLRFWCLKDKDPEAESSGALPALGHVKMEERLPRRSSEPPCNLERPELKLVLVVTKNQRTGT